MRDLAEADPQAWWFLILWSLVDLDFSFRCSDWSASIRNLQPAHAAVTDLETATMSAGQRAGVCESRAAFLDLRTWPFLCVQDSQHDDLLSTRVTFSAYTRPSQHTRDLSAHPRPLYSSCAILGILRTASRTCRQRAGKTGRFWDTSDPSHAPEHFCSSRIPPCMSRIVPRAAKAFADSQAKSWEYRRSLGHFRHSGTLL